ncbi:MAG: helix-turn-helix transcriptional regulator [Mariprofundus sp.]|nr:helix-turn-helix transcriptional regulator [Mariprofundus sp.]
MEQQYNQVNDQSIKLKKLQGRISRCNGDLHALRSCVSEQNELASVYELLQHMQSSIGRNIADLELLLMQLPQYQSHADDAGRHKHNGRHVEANKLSCKEHEVLNALARGYSYNESAKLLGCKLTTIQTHTKRIYKKLRVHSRSEAVYEARQLDLISV